MSHTRTLPITSRRYWKPIVIIKTEHSRLTPYKVKLATEIEGDPKAPFSIATTPSCWGGRYSIPRTAPLYPWSSPIVLSAKQGGIKYHFKVFGMTRPGTEPQSPGPLANTLLIVLMARLLRIVTWNYNCLQLLLIICYLRPYHCLKNFLLGIK